MVKYGNGPQKVGPLKKQVRKPKFATLLSLSTVFSIRIEHRQRHCLLALGERVPAKLNSNVSADFMAALFGVDKTSSGILSGVWAMPTGYSPHPSCK